MVLFVSQFTSLSDRDRVLLEGSWVLDGDILVIGPWTPSFQPSPKVLPSAVICIGLSDLPPVLWTLESLDMIIEWACRLIKFNQVIELLSKGRFARVAVEVDLSRPLVPGADIAIEDDEILSFWQKFEYEHIHLFCC